MTKISPDEAKAISTLLLVIFAMVLIGIVVNKVFKGFSGIAEALGAKSADEKKTDTTIKNEEAKESKQGISSPWNPLYMKANAPTYLNNVTIKKFCEDIAKMIYDGIGKVKDNPTQIMAAIKKCNSKAGISAVATVFMEKYNYDLFNFLTTRLDTTEQKKVLQNILSYVNDLPVK